jgi:hypothetical protein
MYSQQIFAHNGPYQIGGAFVAPVLQFGTGRVDGVAIAEKHINVLVGIGQNTCLGH